jgi:thymidylate synthase
MFDIILAVTNISRGIYGVGKERKLPWNSSEELNLFRIKTDNSVLIMGRKTVETLPELKGRTIVCLSESSIGQCVLDGYSNKVIVCKSLDEALRLSIVNEKKVFIAGGGKLYEEVLTNWYNLINTVHISIMKEKFDCDTFINFDITKFTIKVKEEYKEFVHYMLEYKSSGESKYLKLLEEVYFNGCVTCGRNGKTKSLFGKTLEFDMRDGFPLLTTKNMFFRGIVEELLFFIRGNTDTKILEDKNINIWKGNTNREFLDSIGKTTRRPGVMGQMYGYQWRYFNAEYDEETAKPILNSKGLDQLSNVIKKLRTDPHSRRILLTGFNPLQLDDGVLAPCHSIIIQFYVNEGYLDMFCFNRSSDLFHGLPFNIASSSLLLILISKITNLVPRKFILSLGDCHIYEEHYSVVYAQLSRIPFKFPKIEINKELKELEDIENLEYCNFILNDYKAYPTLKAKMIA